MTTCHECGAEMRHKLTTVNVKYKDLNKDVEVRGRYCSRPGCDASLLVGDEMRPIEQAMLSMKEQYLERKD